MASSTSSCSSKQVLTANGTRIQALLVDDDEEFCNLLKELLEPCGVDIKAVTDPVEALEIFTREKDNFHLVLLDYYMPHLNGTQMWGRLKELNPNVKVILVSAVDEFRLKQILAQCPMDGYIRKPFRIRVAIEVIRHVMTQTGQSLLPTELPTAFKSNVIGDGRRAGNGRGCG